MSLAIFEILDNLEIQNRKKILKDIEDVYPYNKIMDYIRSGKDSSLEFQDILLMLKYFGITYTLGDNIFEKVAYLRDTQINEKRYFKQRKSTTTIYGLLNVITKLKKTIGSYSRYLILLSFLKECNDIETKWAIHLLINKKKMREVILFETE